MPLIGQNEPIDESDLEALSISFEDIRDDALSPHGPAMEFHFQIRSILARLDEEKRLLCSFISGHILVGIIVCFYGGMVLFRNIAFFRHRGLIWYADQVMPDEASGRLTDAVLVSADGTKSVPLLPLLRLWNTSIIASAWNVSVVADIRPDLSKLNGEPFALLDAAHEILPDLSQKEWASDMNEFVATLFMVLTLAMFVVPFFVSFRGKARPHLFAMSLRFVHALTSGNVFRILTYLATSIPGPAVHCQSVHWMGRDGSQGSEEINREHVMTVSSWFLSTWNRTNDSNCGDLVFSGHTFQAVTNAVTITYYAIRIFPRGLAWVCIGLSWACLVVQCFFVLTTFNHYGVDMVIALYVAPLNWLLWCYLRPEDPTPETMHKGHILTCGKCAPKPSSAQT